MNALRKATHWQALMLGLVLSLAACELPEDPDGGDLPPGSYVPSVAAGKWKGGILSHSNFWDDHSGAYQGTALGLSILFHFQASGRYQQATYIISRNYGCEKQIWSTTEGGVTFDDDTFQVIPTSGKYKIRDSCNSQNNEERPLRSHELKGAMYYWSPAMSAEGEPVLLIGPNPDSRETFRRDN